MKKILALLVLTLITTISFGQDNYQDVVYLNNGSVIRGIIIEQIPNQSIKIETPDRSIFVFQMDEIEKITKEEKLNTNNRKRGYIGLGIGANIPIGKYADINNGGATTGAQISLINFGYLFSDKVGLTATWFGASNPIEGVSSNYMWSYGGILAGPLFSFPLSEKIEWDIKPMIGISWASILNTNIGISYSLGLNIGTGIRFNVGRVIALTIDVDYKVGSYQWTLGQQTISTIGIKGGFAFRLK